MAWPNDARHHTFAAGNPVPADSLNAIQDAIVGLHENRVKIVRGNFRTNTNYWEDSLSVSSGVVCVATGATDSLLIDLPVDIPAGANATLTNVELKILLHAASGLTFDLYELDTNMDVDINGPSEASILSAPVTPTIGAGYPNYTTVTLTPAATWTFDEEKTLFVIATDPDVDDTVYAARVAYEIMGA